MQIKALVSDIYTTLIDIKTDEKDMDVYRRLSDYLKYQGIYLAPEELKWFFFEKKARQKRYNQEQYPEHDYRRIWYEILYENQYSYIGQDINQSATIVDLVKLHRSLTVKQIRLYRGTFETLSQLNGKYKLGIVSNSQQDHAYPELRMLGIHDFFDHIIISGEFGYKKPDTRLFHECLRRLGVKPEEAVYVGNDTFKDVKGAQDAGMKAILIMTRHGDKETPGVRPDYVIERMEQVLEVLKDLARR